MMQWQNSIGDMMELASQEQKTVGVIPKAIFGRCGKAA